MADWIKQIRDEVSAGAYQPSPMIIVDAPKSDLAIRTGSWLSLSDHLLYTAIVQRWLPKFWAKMEWSQAKVSFGYQLAPLGRTYWIRPSYESWKSFSNESISRAQQSKFVLITDIAGFYDNIESEDLMSDLRAIGCTEEELKPLRVCLDIWRPVRTRGLPQGCSPSDILANLYLNGIDEALQSAGLRHLRYVDDIRFFCDTKADASRALVNLNGRLRRQGLTLQTKKTEIRTGLDAKAKFEGVSLIINEVFKDLLKAAGMPEAYVEIWELENELDINDEEMPVEVIKTAFDENFANSTREFDSTLFHFLLRRLRKQGDDHAIPYCLHILGSHPEETADILSYFDRLDDKEGLFANLIHYLTQSQWLYDYQAYLLLVWQANHLQQCPPELLAYARKVLAAPCTTYLRSAARVLVGKFGTDSDLDDLANSYQVAGTSLEKGEIMCCLQRLEKGKRNTLFAKWNDGSLYVRRAIAFCKEQ